MNCNKSLSGGVTIYCGECGDGPSSGYPCCPVQGSPIPRTCDFETWPLAMAYVPMQPWEQTYDPAGALKAGTLFPRLDLPFAGGGVL